MLTEPQSQIVSCSDLKYLKWIAVTFCIDIYDLTLPASHRLVLAQYNVSKSNG